MKPGYAPHRRFRDAFLLLAAFCSFTTLIDLMAKPTFKLWTATRLVGTVLLLAVLVAWAVTAFARHRRKRDQG